jgi:hypothetical protein
MTEATIEYRLIVRRRKPPGILLRSGEGGWVQPCFVLPDHHTADVDCVDGFRH